MKLGISTNNNHLLIKLKARKKLKIIEIDIILKQKFPVCVFCR